MRREANAHKNAANAFPENSKNIASRWKKKLLKKTVLKYISETTQKSPNNNKANTKSRQHTAATLLFNVVNILINRFSANWIVSFL